MTDKKMGPPIDRPTGFREHLGRLPVSVFEVREDHLLSTAQRMRLVRPSGA